MRTQQRLNPFSQRGSIAADALQIGDLGGLVRQFRRCQEDVFDAFRVAGHWSSDFGSPINARNDADNLTESGKKLTNPPPRLRSSRGATRGHMSNGGRRSPETGPARWPHLQSTAQKN